MPAKTKGLYANIHAKQERIKKGSHEKMRKPGSEGAPTAKAFKQSEMTAKDPKKKSASKAGKLAAKKKTPAKSKTATRTKESVKRKTAGNKK
jgi:hypothetical protein